MMLQVSFAAFGCQMLAALDSKSDRAAQFLARVPGWFAAWEQRFSRFREDSELSQLNRRRGTPVRVSWTLWRVMQASLSAAQATNGLVSPALLAELEAVGYDRSFLEIDSNAQAPLPISKAISDRWQAIRCDRKSRTISLPADVRVDLGGIAKGWAADQAARRLGKLGPSLVDAGGDIAVSAPPRGKRGWLVGVADPIVPDGQIALLCLARGGVATSGRDYRRWRRDGCWLHHLIDPRTGLPAKTDVLTSTVIAPSGTQAEVAAKVVLILGRRAGLAWLESQAALAGLMVCSDGSVIKSQRLRYYIWE